MKGALPEDELSNVGYSRSRRMLARRPVWQAPDALHGKDAWMCPRLAGMCSLRKRSWIWWLEALRSLCRETGRQTSGQCARPRAAQPPVWVKVKWEEGSFLHRSRRLLQDPDALLPRAAGFFDGASFIVVGSEGFVLLLGEAVGLQKEVGAVHHCNARIMKALPINTPTSRSQAPIPTGDTKTTPEGSG